ncbi:hypothetical protein EKH55_2958 [Sinorhizobium alkalisoli]|nr:hypothetical protein EKH55_2958 [Sinorhizobium alkalisoli]
MLAWHGSPFVNDRGAVVPVREGESADVSDKIGGRCGPRSTRSLCKADAAQRSLRRKLRRHCRMLVQEYAAEEAFRG